MGQEYLSSFINTTGFLNKINTTSNTGSGKGLALALVGTDAPFKSLNVDDVKLVISSTATEISFGFGIVSIGDLSDVTIAGIAVDDVLKWSGTEFDTQRVKYFIASPAGTAGGNNDSRFIAPFGSVFRATEAQVDTDIPTFFSIESITVNIQTNGKDGNTIVSFNDDTVSIISITVATTATGDFSTSDDVSIATNSNCDWEFDYSASTDGNTTVTRQVLAVCF